MSNSTMHDRVVRAEERIRPFIRETYLEFSEFLSDTCGHEVYLKLENLQLTGSFKLRGAFNKLLSMESEEASQEVITASTGNHGLAMAYALKTIGRRGVIYLPETVNLSKLDSLRRFGVRLVFHGRECGDAERQARRVAEENRQVYVSPYNDPDIVAGQGTVGVELDNQLPDLNAVFVSVGGGGLISGIGAYLKHGPRKVTLVGCLPANSPVMYECVLAGRIVECPCRDTLSDGTAGAVEPGSITFDLCRDLVDHWVLVSEEEIQEAMRLMVTRHHMIVEGSAAVAIAALLGQRDQFEGSRVAVVICGGNVDLDTLRRILA